jgi:hypothetical protein
MQILNVAPNGQHPQHISPTICFNTFRRGRFRLRRGGNVVQESPTKPKHIAINDLCKLCQRWQAVGLGIQIAQLASSANPAQPSSGSKHSAIQQES